MLSALVVPQKIRAMLKKPLGKLHAHFEDVKKLSKNHRIISVGDLCTLALLGLGIRPHLAVFDFRYMRKNLDNAKVAILKREFKKMKIITNKAGTISRKLLKNAKQILKKGGSILVKGEEDLTALPFIKYADKKTIVIYGQPHQGIVAVQQNKQTKKRINKLFKEIMIKKSIKNKIRKPNHRTRNWEL